MTTAELVDAVCGVLKANVEKDLRFGVASSNRYIDG